MTPADPRLLDPVLLRLAAKRRLHRQAMEHDGPRQAVVLELTLNNDTIGAPAQVWGREYAIVLPIKAASVNEWVNSPLVQRLRQQLTEKTSQPPREPGATP